MAKKTVIKKTVAKTPAKKTVMKGTKGTTKKPKTEGVVRTDTVIARTNQVYMSLGQLGNLDENCKSIMSVTYGGKIIADPDRCLKLVSAFIDEFTKFVIYSSNEKAEADLKEFKEFVKEMKVV